MNGIDPKWVFYLGILVTIETAIGQGTVKLTNLVPDSWVPLITGWCTLLAFIGNVVMTALAGYSSKQVGPLVKPLVLVAVILGSMFGFAGDAHAQARKPATPQTFDLGQKIKDDFTAATGVKATGDVGYDLLKVLDTKLLPDLQYAKKLADANGNKLTGDCWAAWINIIQTNDKAVQNPDGSPQDAPTPHLITDLERAIDIRNQLQPSSPFMIACSPVANLIRTDVMNFVGQVVGGGISLTKLVPIL